MYIGYLILKEIQKRDAEKISIYDVSKALKKPESQVAGN